jgi:pimeloyl-ACP methyl ester carboxylesterase
LRRSAPERPGRRRFVAASVAAALGVWTPGATQPRKADDGETVTVDGVPIHFVRLGAGPPVVVLHGASGNLRDWTFGPAQAIARSNTVIAVDRPGNGLSGLPDRGGERLDVQAALLRGALEQLGVGRVTLVGHSYGGSVALAWALDAPESLDGLVLLAAPSQVWDGGLGFRTNLLALVSDACGLRQK